MYEEEKGGEEGEGAGAAGAGTAAAAVVWCPKLRLHVSSARENAALLMYVP